MKRVFRSGVAVAALIGLAGSAYAADIARRVQKPVAPAPYVAPVYNWSGLYAGVYGGGGWGTAEISGRPARGSMGWKPTSAGAASRIAPPAAGLAAA